MQEIYGGTSSVGGESYIQGLWYSSEGETDIEKIKRIIAQAETDNGIDLEDISLNEEDIVWKDEGKYTRGHWEGLVYITVSTEIYSYTIEEFNDYILIIYDKKVATTYSSGYGNSYTNEISYDLYSREDWDKYEEEVIEKTRNGLLVSKDPSKILYFINYARLYLNAADDDAYIPMAFGYLFIYIVLVVFTAMFAIRYAKRVIYIAFLTLMAPMVALTYPLDKIKDRKSTSI